MTDGVTDNIVWIQGTRISWFNTGLGPKKKKKAISIIYLICNIYCIYLICILYIYILHIYVESKVRGI